MKYKVNALFKEIIICAFILLVLTGCRGGREINDLQIVIGIGVDNDKASGNVLFTAQIVKPAEIGKTSGGDNGGGDRKAFWNVNSIRPSIFEAAREITHKTGNRLFVSHSQIVIFGNDIASGGLEKYIDFFLRSHEMRPTTLILIAEGTASEVMDVKHEKEQLPAMNIAKIVMSYGFTSHLYKVNLQDFSERMLSKTTAQIAPLVGLSYDKGKKEIYVSGMAVFKNAKMVGTLNHDETRGLLWTLGKVEGGIVDVPTPDGKGKAILEIIGAKGKVIPEIRDGKIYMHVNIKEEASLAEQTTTENLATLTAIEKLQEKQNDIIKQEVIAAFNKSKKLNSDIFGFGDMIHKKYRSQWKQLEDNWDKLYSSIELIVNVETKIRKTDLLTRPTVPKKGK